MEISRAQQNLLDKMRAGASLEWRAQQGKYQLVDGPIVRTVNWRTVDQLVKAKKVQRTLVGNCSLANDA